MAPWRRPGSDSIHRGLGGGITLGFRPGVGRGHAPCAAGRSGRPGREPLTHRDTEGAAGHAPGGRQGEPRGTGQAAPLLSASAHCSRAAAEAFPGLRLFHKIFMEPGHSITNVWCQAAASSFWDLLALAAPPARAHERAPIAAADLRDQPGPRTCGTNPVPCRPVTSFAPEFKCLVGQEPRALPPARARAVAGTDPRLRGCSSSAGGPGHRAPQGTGSTRGRPRRAQRAHGIHGRLSARRAGSLGGPGASGTVMGRRGSDRAITAPLGTAGPRRRRAGRSWSSLSCALPWPHLRLNVRRSLA